MARRDPLYRLATNWLAAQRLAACAELLADDWAAHRTARPLDLAECLTKVARWGHRPMTGFPVPTMAAGTSELRQRVERLVRGEGLATEPRRPLWAAPIVAFVLTALTLLPPSACGVAEAKGLPPSTPAAQKGAAPGPRPTPAALADEEDEEDEVARGPGRIRVRVPRIGAPVQIDLDRLQKDIEASIPSREALDEQIERALAEAREQAPDAATRKRIEKDIKRARKDARAELEEAREEMQERLRELREQLPEIRRRAVETAREASEQAREETLEQARETEKKAKKARKKAKDAPPLPPMPPSPPAQPGPQGMGMPMPPPGPRGAPLPPPPPDDDDDD